ncbi:hypothetical protein ANCCEY_08185 [Ancylostoma ceylanicum]|uniref:Uncharacterized protein n=2 Tax=Ancylostoma ceylanicum TaxID=53326 RepID=A0A8I3B0H8_9BILA|nr:hypothetical protein ANCCEY_08185 [Ancylostoma ceylanicum]EYB86809.1 hypothetical protein Y032_0272g911 [Ancylostoma ceylanicum]
MLHKNLKVLKRSISEKILRRTPQQKADVPCTVSNRQSGSSQSSHDEDDPYREILRTYNDNVSHLVFHGSSLKSMSSIEFGSINHSMNSAPTCHVHFDDSADVGKARPRKAMNA